MEPGNVKVSEFIKRIESLEKENDHLKDIIMGLINQFSGYGLHKGVLCRNTMGLYDLENAYNTMRLEDPHPCPEHECDINGCNQKATCGMNTLDGYKHVCGNHFNVEGKG